MKIVIQCAARKDPAAASFIAPDGRRVLFIAHPDGAPADRLCAYARPDDLSEDGHTWRSRLLDQNTNGNRLGLLPAYRLYAQDAYRELVDKFGVNNIFILSAGWGLIPATFPTPMYDITFTVQADPWKRRRKGDQYEDFCMLPDDGEEILFLGGKDYLPLFAALTGRFKGRKTIVFNAAVPPKLPAGFTLLRYPTSTRTNWHYEAARELMRGTLAL